MQENVKHSGNPQGLPESEAGSLCCRHGDNDWQEDYGDNEDDDGNNVEGSSEEEEDDDTSEG